jgi:hypothetical protein
MLILTRSNPGLRPCREPLFDNLVGERQYLDGNFEPNRLGGLEVDDQLELGRLKHGQVAGLFALENSAGINSQ